MIPKVHKETVKRDGATQKIKVKWWEQPKTEMYRHVIGVVNSIEQNQSYRRIKNMQSARLYSNNNFQSFYGTGFARSSANTTTNRVTLNVIKSVIDTAFNRISKSKPRPMFLTEKGNWEQQNRAKKLNKYIEGSFDALNMYGLGQEVFRGAEIFGTGAVKFFGDENIVAERVMIDEIKVDDTDGMYGSPRQLFQTKYIHRDILIDMFPKDSGKISAVKGGIEGEAASSSTADMIKVVEAWHLPSGEAKDGKHLIVIDTCTLFEEDYDKDYFPFVFFRWSKPIIGFYGSGVPEEISGIQIEINKLLQNIQVSQHLMSHPKWLVDNSSGVNTEHLNNQNGGIIKFNGVPPQAFVPPAMSAEVYQHLENLYIKAFEITGISQLSATGRKPDGLSSGKALREYSDIDSERFVVLGQMYEAFYLDCAKMIIRLSRDMYKDNKNLTIKVKGKNFIETIQWKEVDIDDDKYVMTAYPVSQLPKTPSGRLEYVQELLQSGFIESQYALDLLDFPDIQEYTSNKTASVEILKQVLGKIIEDGEYSAPEPYMDLQYNIDFTQRAYLQAKMDGVPEDRLELLRQFMDQNQSMINKMQEMMPQAPMQEEPMQEIDPTALGMTENPLAIA